jgi:membrane fusion protein, multidrug efflux system
MVVLVIAGAYFAWNAFQYEGTDDAQVDGHVMMLSPRVNGHIKAVYVDEGQLVHAGEAIITIDAQDYKIAEELSLLRQATVSWTLPSLRTQITSGLSADRKLSELDDGTSPDKSACRK